MKRSLKIMLSLMILTLFAIPAINANITTLNTGNREVECHLTGATNIANGDILYVTSTPTIYFECGDAIDEVIVQVSGINSEEFSIYEKAYTLEPGKSNGLQLSDVLDGFYTFEYYGRIDIESSNPESTGKTTFVVFEGTSESWDTEEYALKVDTKGPKFRAFNAEPKNGAKTAWTVTAHLEDPVGGIHEVSLLIKGEEYDLIRDKTHPEYPDAFVWDITGITGITSGGEFKVVATDWVGHSSEKSKGKGVTETPLFIQIIEKLASMFPMFYALLF